MKVGQGFPNLHSIQLVVAIIVVLLEVVELQLLLCHLILGLCGDNVLQVLHDVAGVASKDTEVRFD